MYMENLKLLRQRVDHIEEDLIEVKKSIIQIEEKDKGKAEAAWKDLMLISKEISKSWKGPSAVEEIRSQREKGI